MRISSFIPTCLLTACAAMVPAQTFTLVHVFHGPDGGDPESAAIVEDSSGNLYSTTAFGGASGLGTVYKIEKKGNNKETVLHSFTGGADGQNSFTGVTLGSDGNIYGTANGGGTNGFGTAFRATPAGAFTAFYEFQGGAKAAFPEQLITGPSALYGIAGGGAPFYGGMVYRLNTSGETDLYKFAGGADGNHPTWLVRDSAGNLYGTAGGGDLTCSPTQGCGVIFKIDTKGAYSVLHVFVGPDGNGPRGLILDSASNLYGTTGSGGAHDSGTVFELTPAGKLITLYAFTGGADGQFPQSGVISDASGNLYGTTSSGGITTSQCSDLACGVVFMLSPTAAGVWKETVLHSFTGPDGDNPLGPLLLDPSEPALYGTTYRGGDFSCSTINGGSSCGVVFKITR
jgi:uncharacterized repeat protein (TIGR03803 family)